MTTPTFDVAVLGGGPAGYPAALQAARAGASVLLVEKNAHLGGTTTVAAVTGIQSFFGYGQHVIAGIGWDVVCRSYAVLGQPPPTGERMSPKHGGTTTDVDRTVYTALIDEAVIKAGITLRLHTMLAAIAPTDDGGWRLTLCGKEGLFDALARTVIDCSGDANACQLAGLPVIRRREQQPATLVMSVAGYDKDAIDFDALGRAADDAVAAGELKKSDLGYNRAVVTWFLRAGGGNAVHVAAEESTSNAADSPGRTAVELEARRAMMRLLRFFRKQPALEQLRITWFAAETGIRETAVIDARTMITEHDYTSGRLWDDAICYSFYPVDIHTEDGVDLRPLARGVLPTIPFSAMLPREGRNIIAAGRCIGGDRAAFSAYRVQASCMAMGQAAGAAAAIATRDGIDIADAPVDEIRSLTAEHGAIVPPTLNGG